MFPDFLKKNDISPKIKESSNYPKNFKEKIDWSREKMGNVSKNINTLIQER